MLTRKIPLLFKAPALFAVFAAGLCLAPSAAVAGECDRIAEVARQNAALYRDSGDPHHRAAAEAQQNGYNACVNSVRQHAASVGSRSLLQEVGIQVGTAVATELATRALQSLMGELGKVNRLENNNANARAIEAQLARERELVRQNELEMQRLLAAAAERQRVAEAAALKERCISKNPFGGSAAHDCGGEQLAAASPFGATKNPFARIDIPARESALPAGKSGSGDCPTTELFADGCMDDGFRQALTAMGQSDGTQQTASDASLVEAHLRELAAYNAVPSQEQLERLARGEVTYAQVLEENNQQGTPAQQEQRIAALVEAWRNNPALLEGIKGTIQAGNTAHALNTGN